ncbi:GNAT family N-acetyltransferase [Gaeumannomyces tritici R3-111a-1]|uniref:GNAT family N-acetyltransferase n=1 Tax=Gaeumannomyces tritici (strain R3-111a-1) TaxID=644352 RepID=J3NUM3_GAET3|nr:GNAT family N-acetyltransferase [Gaeumannomyces tritici R3-111a-1]EJT79896.1 GNAT family N-acetyltransferase [Gaeumannomyces tritici R3-111a-1]
MPPTAAPTTAAACCLSPQLPPNYTLNVGMPPVPAYRNLRVAAGLTSITEPQASRAISGTWYGCHIRYAVPPHQSSNPTVDQVVGMGRIISDGGWYFHIADMAVLPEHQRQGLGVAIMQELLAYIEQNKPSEGVPNINLMADPPGISLYKKTGFVYSSNVGEHGMVWVGDSRNGGQGFASDGNDGNKWDGGS